MTTRPPASAGVRVRASRRTSAGWLPRQGPRGEPTLTPSDASAVSDNWSARSVSDAGLARIASIGG